MPDVSNERNGSTCTIYIYGGLMEVCVRERERKKDSIFQLYVWRRVI